MPVLPVARTKASCLRRFSLLLFCCGLLFTPVTPGWGNDTEGNSLLTAWETQLFQETHPQEAESDRLSRIETLLLGEPQTADLTARKNQIQTLVQGLQRQSPPSEPSASQTSGQPSPRPQTTSPSPDQAPQTVNEDYPTITAMEQAVWGRTFTVDTLNQRLERLEQKVFQQTFPQQSLSERSDKLYAAIPVFTPADSSEAPSKPTPSLFPSRPHHSTPMLGLENTLRELEQRIFPESVIPLEGLITERLDRMERQVFDQTFLGESVSSRIMRLQYELQRQPVEEMGHSIPLNNLITPPSAVQGRVRQNTFNGYNNSNRYGGSVGQDAFRQYSPTQQTITRRTVISAPGTVIIQQTETLPGNNPNFWSPNSRPTPSVTPNNLYGQGQGTLGYPTYADSPYGNYGSGTNGW